MPTISSFLGITVYMYWRDHNPPHFHAEYGEHVALVDIQELCVLEGKLPRRALLSKMVNITSTSFFPYSRIRLRELYEPP